MFVWRQESRHGGILMRDRMIRTSTILAASAVAMLISAPCAVTALWSLHTIGIYTLCVAAIFRLTND